MELHKEKKRTQVHTQEMFATPSFTRGTTEEMNWGVGKGKEAAIE